MLRRADNVTVTHQSGLFTSNGWVLLHVGRRAYRVVKMRADAFATLQRQQQGFPVRIAGVDQRHYWQFQGKFYWDNDGLDAHQIHALLVSKQQREAARIERAQATVALGAAPRQRQVRGAIPDDVKQLVWTRDQGRCRHCGATTELQFDHVIPVAFGGGSAPENLQVLCGPCNRSKAAGLTVRR